MENEVILKKIESLNQCIQRIEHKRPKKLEELQNSLDLQDIISINLERSVQLSVDIASIICAEKNLETPDSMAGAFEILSDNKLIPSELSEKLQKAVGFRNISVHEYDKLDWKIVFDIITHHLGNFRDYVKFILNLPIV